MAHNLAQTRAHRMRDNKSNGTNKRQKEHSPSTLKLLKLGQKHVAVKKKKERIVPVGNAFPLVLYNIKENNWVLKV